MRGQNVCIAAGNWLWGATAQNYLLATALEVSAGALLFVAAIEFILPIQECVERDNTPSEGVATPALGPLACSGPIVVKINYQIAPENIDAFLDLMRQRQRVRSRIGARQWTLSRNLQDPSQWTKTFRAATWGDHPENHRLTAVDKQLDDRVSQLHSGALPPSVDFLIERPTAPVGKTIPLRPVIPQP